MRGSAAFRTGVAPGGALAGPWVKNELWRRARAVPSLDLQFADSKSLVDATTKQNLVTFTRASSGTYVGSDGLIKTATTNEPRFDHKPTTGESLGLLVEEQRTNLLLTSGTIGGSNWVNQNSIVVTTNTTDVTDPSGQNTATKLSYGLSNSQSIQTVALTAVVHTLSVWARVASGTATLRLQVFLQASPFTGIGQADFTVTTVWQRFSVTTSSATATNYNAAINLPNAATTLYVWGAQLEAGAFPTSYIPTTTATVTRSADVASISGSNFSSWYRQDEGTVFADAIHSAASCSLCCVSDNSNNNRILIDTLSTGASRRNIVTASAVAQVSLTISSPPSIRQATAITYKLDDFILSNAGALSSADTSGSLPTVDRLYVGSNASGAIPLNGTIRRLTYWPQRLSNSTLQTITQ